ncbi:MAG: hypothetical protein ACO3JJ_16065 [Opitutaceae bacterium]
MKSSPPPGLPTWLFILTDLALLGAAAIVAWASPAPLSTGALVAIVGCVLLGILVGLVPLVLRVERAKNTALDERQRALEALAETVRESAQQVSIATGSLHGIAELARRTLREAEQLPERLQERVSALQGQLTEADEGARAGLEEELAALRGSELARIEAAVAQIARTATELTRLEAAAAKQVATLQRETADSAARLQQAIAAAREEGGAALEAQLREARASLAAAAEATTAAWRETTKAQLAALDERLTRLAALPRTEAAGPAEPPAAEIATGEVTLPSPRKPRRPRREETPVPAPDQAMPPAAAEAASRSVESAAAPEPAAAVPIPAPEVAAEPAPAPAEPPAPPAPPSAPEAQPALATPTPEPAAPGERPSEVPAAVTPLAPPPADPLPEPPAPAPEPPPPLAPRKRPIRRVEPEPQPTLDFGFEDSPPASPGTVERTLTSDGATRLLVTAYIGIGNRLFIRGDGPGLSWERGVPLQFISIGKWRWETGEASGPIRFRVYKNDELECSTLGEQVLDPGYLQEVTASF